MRRVSLDSSIRWRWRGLVVARIAIRRWRGIMRVRMMMMNRRIIRSKRDGSRRQSMISGNSMREVMVHWNISLATGDERDVWVEPCSWISCISVPHGLARADGCIPRRRGPTVRGLIVTLH